MKKLISNEFIEEFLNQAPKKNLNSATELARNAKFLCISHTHQDTSDEELIFNVQIPGLYVAPRLTLWPNALDAFCNCKSNIEPCQHILAICIAIKNNFPTVILEEQNKTINSIEYEIKTTENEIFLYRYLITQNEKKIFHESLLSQEKLIQASKEDYGLEAMFDKTLFGKIHKYQIPKIFKLLSLVPKVYFNGHAIQVSDKVLTPSIDIILNNDLATVRLITKLNDAKSEPQIIQNTIAKIENTIFYYNENLNIDGTIINLSPTTKKFLESLKKQTQYLNYEQTKVLLSLIIPELQNHTQIDINTELHYINDTEEIEPELDFKIETLVTGENYITPYIKYGSNPTYLIIDNQGTKILDSTKLIKRNFFKEENLIKNLKSQYYLSFGVPSKLNLNESFNFFENLENTKNLSENLKEKFQEWILLIKNSKNINPQKKAPFFYKILEKENLFFNAKEKFLHEKDGAKKELEKLQNNKNLWETLRDYQKEGATWLTERLYYGFGCLLADDMGLGKTIQAICAIAGKTLVLAPTSVLKNWENEILKFRPELKTLIYHGKSRDQNFNSFDVIITSFNLLRIDFSFFEKQNFKTIIIDEAQNIKNIHTKLTQSVLSLNADRRIALSGTPIENKIDDLISIFSFLNPGLLSDNNKNTFNNLEQLKEQTKPFILRRLKKDIALELPPKTITNLRVELSEEEQALYDFIQNTYQIDNRSTFEIFEKILRLRQVCLDPRCLFNEKKFTLPQNLNSFFNENFELSSKTKLCLELAKQSLENEHKILIFSQFTSYLNYLESAFFKNNLKTLRIDGSTHDRQSIIEKFKQNEASILLISLKAGGTGLNITEADHVFILDPWWNPYIEMQAMDRAHRIGQTKPVFVYRFITANTIEEKILLMQEEKKQLSETLLSDTENASQLDEHLESQDINLSKEELLSLLK
jgi:SNF2 family DNA or RNA helicase